MSFNAQLIDQRVEGLVARLSERFLTELRIRNDPDRLKSAAFVFLVAKTLLELDDDQVIDGMVEGGGDFGVDAVYFGAPVDGEFAVNLIQGKYKRSLDEDSEFPESGVVKMLEAIRTLFNPGRQYTANDRLTRRVEEIRSLIREGNIPQVRVILCNNGRAWNRPTQERIDSSGLGSLVLWVYSGPADLLKLMRSRKAIETKIQLSGRAIVEDYPYMRAMIGRMSVSELAKLFEEHGMFC